MKQVVAVAGKVQVSEVPKPACGDNGILVQTAYSIISTGTETWTIDSTEPISAGDLVKDSSKLTKAVDLSRKVLREEGVNGFLDYYRAVKSPEFPIGYSSAGTVIKVGKNVTDVLIGDRVACAGEGKACHAEIVSVPRNLAVKVPAGVKLNEAAFATIGAIALHAFRQSRAQVGENVAVLGAGLVGNIVSQIARASGCKVVTLDLRPDRLELAKAVGIDYTLLSNEPDLLQRLSHITGGLMFDVVILCAATTSSDPINLASKILRSKGRLVVVGRVGMDLERKEFYQKELELIMSRSLGPGRYDFAYEEKGVDYPVDYVRWTLNRNMQSFLGLIESKRINVDSLVGAEYELEQAPEAYAYLEKQSRAAIALRYPPLSEQLLSTSPLSTNLHRDEPAQFKKVSGRRINTALVGPGNFAKETLIPILRGARENYDLKWVVSSNPVHATQISKRYRIARSTCEFSDVLKDAAVDLVIIAAPNNLHLDMVIQALKAAKPVFVEKPLCLNESELDEIKEVQKETNIPIFVGFNRRYAPQILQIKEQMEKLGGPFMLSYRANVGFIPMNRWVQDPEIGGGRIIAECCHFFDLFNFLLGRSGPEIQVASTEINGSSSVTKDNVSVTLKYPDGSVANLIYVSLGDKRMDRERLEVYGQGTSMVIEDFRKLFIWGPRPLNQTLPRQEKGWTNEFQELAKFFRGEPNSMITFKECVDATELTFRVEEALRSSGS